jgi:hypothetical protein
MSVTRTGRPTDDPKGERVTVRLAERDIEALRSVAQREGLSVSEAARMVLRKALRIPVSLRRGSKVQGRYNG